MKTHEHRSGRKHVHLWAVLAFFFTVELGAPDRSSFGPGTADPAASKGASPANAGALTAGGGGFGPEDAGATASGVLSADGVSD